MNLLHDVEPGTKEKINVIIEINRGSKNKYEIDKKTGLIALDRTAHTSQDFPFDYGFIPQTLWDDGSPHHLPTLAGNFGTCASCGSHEHGGRRRRR